jgi:hypothetical protein
MKYKPRTFVLLLVGALGLARGLEGEQPLANPLRLEVNLADGSLLVGETSLEKLPLIHEGMGTIDIQLGFVDTISFSQDQPPVSVVLRNGDMIHGAIAGSFEFPLKTLAGQVSVRMGGIREIRVHPGGSDRVVDWVSLPFPGNSDWRDRGVPANISGEEIVLKGQPVWTEQAFFPPATIECDATLDQIVSDDGCFWIILVPEGKEVELNIPPHNVAIQVGYHERGEDTGMFTISRGGGGGPADLGKGPFTFEAGKPSHLKIEVSADAIRATLNGEAFDDKERLLFKRFHIELMGWQPTNTWHVREFTVR